MSAGARFTVMREGGSLKPRFFSAANTRSLLSRTAPSARPTMVKEGMPCRARSASRTTVWASTPARAADMTRDRAKTTSGDNGGAREMPPCRGGDRLDHTDFAGGNPVLRGSGLGQATGACAACPPCPVRRSLSHGCSISLSVSGCPSRPRGNQVPWRKP
jgi:hypothetical protein